MSWHIAVVQDHFSRAIVAFEVFRQAPTAAIKSMKYEYLKKILVPLSLTRMQAEIAAYARWYNTVRPHAALDGATPADLKNLSAS